MPGLFMAQHSGMARRGFKRVLTGHVPRQYRARVAMLLPGLF